MWPCEKKSQFCGAGENVREGSYGQVDVLWEKGWRTAAVLNGQRRTGGAGWQRDPRTMTGDSGNGEGNKAA